MKQSFFARRSYVIILVMTFLLPFIWIGTRQALRSNRNDVKDWLPAHFEETARHRWFQEHFPFEQFVLCSWDGCTLDDQRLELLAKKLVPEPSPESGGDSFLKSGAAPSPEWRGESGSPDGPPAPSAARTSKPPPDEPQYFKSVLTGPRLVNELENRYPELSDEEILTRLEGTLIGKDRHKTCLVVTLTEEAKGKNLRKALEKIRELARESNIEPPLADNGSRHALRRAWDSFIVGVRELVFGLDPPGKGVRMGGPPVDNVAIDVEGERTLMRLAGLSAIVGLGISMVCFRSARLTAMVFWIALLAAGIGLAAVFFSRSSVDAILLSMPALVYVLAISGAVHIINYYHDGIRENGLSLAPERALGHGWFPCTMAAVTTAIGLASLYTSHVIPIAKFGIFSAIGVLATLGLLFLLLPALLHYFPSRQLAGEHGGKGHPESADTVFLRFWRMAGGFIVRNNIAVSAVCLVVMIFFAAGLTRIHISVKLMKFFSPDAEIIHHYRWLENHLGPLVPMEVVIKVDNEKCKLSLVDRMRLAQRVEKRMEGLDAVGGALSAATFGPDIRPSRRKVGGFARIVGLNAKMQQRLRNEELSEVLARHRAEFRDYLTVEGNPTLDELGITGRLAWRLQTQDLGTLKKIEHYGDPQQSIAANLASLQGIGHEQAAEVEEVIGRWQAEHGVELWRVTARVEALSDLDYAKFVPHLKEVVEPVLADCRASGVQGIEAVYTGLVPLVYKTQHELLRGLFKSLTLAFVLIAFVMMFVLKSPAAGMLSMIPNVFPVVVIFGVMGWTGILVDVGSMMCASVALGIAIDDTMHYLTWFRKGLDSGLDRKRAAMRAYERCGTAMSQTTLIGGLGLSVFAFSTFTPSQQFGIMMLVLLFAALFGDLIFLPALLTGPLGRFFDRRDKRKGPDVWLREEAAHEKAAKEHAASLPVETPAGTPHTRSDAPQQSH